MTEQEAESEVKSVERFLPRLIDKAPRGKANVMIRYRDISPLFTIVVKSPGGFIVGCGDSLKNAMASFCEAVKRASQ